MAARLVHGPGTLGYDAVWSLRWGDELLFGTPALDAPEAPTPHPLAILVSAAAMVLREDAATTVLLAVSWLSLGALAVYLARLGTALFNRPVGILAAAALLTRELVLVETAQALVDLPFLALAVAAADREVRGRRGAPVLLLLAGLLRPEGWALGLAYLAYRRNALPLLAPLLWAVMDWWATGDPLHSLHGTRALADELGRPQSTGSALELAPATIRDIVQEPLVWVALAGAVVGILKRPRPSLLPGAVIVLGLAGYLVLGVAGLPLLGRYLLLPVTMLLLFAGVAVFGGPRLAGIAAAVVIAIGVPDDLRRVGAARDFGATIHATRSAVCDDDPLDRFERAASRLYC